MLVEYIRTHVGYLSARSVPGRFGSFGAPALIMFRIIILKLYSFYCYDSLSTKLFLRCTQRLLEILKFKQYGKRFKLNIVANEKTKCNYF